MDFTRIDRDKDNDNSPYDDTNNDRVLKLGQPAGRADRQKITSLIERYYAAAVAEDGAKGCSMLYSTLAEASPEDYGVYGEPYMRGAKTCAEVLVRVFKYLHRQIVAEAASLSVAHIRLEEGRRGVAVLSFERLPEREIAVRREAQTWKINALFDDELP